LLLNSKIGLDTIPLLAPKRAFDLGIEWFCDLVFFYGVLFAIAGYEMNKAEKARIAQENLLEKLENHQIKYD